MDLYTTSFSIPRPSIHTTHTSSPLHTTIPIPSSAGIDLPNLPLPSTAPPPTAPPSKPPPTSTAQAEKDWVTVQQLAAEIMTREGCLVTVTKEPTVASADTSSNAGTPSPAVLNFHLSGSYQSVMAARGAVLREYPRSNRFVLKISRADVLDSPSGGVGALKPNVQSRLDSIAAETHAHIEVVNSEATGGDGGGQVLGVASGAEPAEVKGHNKRRSGGSGASLSSAPGSIASSAGASSKARVELEGKKDAVVERAEPVTYGMQAERTCEIVITGKLESVEVAKVLVLVLLDELSGLHAEACEIDYKLHAIIAGRRRTVIQSIREETATNIYLPTPLVGIHDRPQPGAPHTPSYRSLHPGGGGMMPMSSQNTGMTQTTGYSQSQSSMGNGWGVGPQMTGQGNGMMGGYGQHRHQPGQGFHPHQPMQYPYHPHQQQQYEQHTPRGMPYSGPGGYGQHQHQMPVSMQNTGMSSMTGFQTPRGMSPRHMMGGHYNQQHNHHNQHQHHQHNQHYNHGQQHHGYNHNQHQQWAGGPASQPPQMGMNPYANGNQNGPNHVHVGLGGHVHNGMGMGMNGGGQMGLNMGVNIPGQYGQGPHPGLAIHGGEQGSLGKASQVWITGEFFGVQRAREMLFNVAMQKSKMVISRDTAILPRKLDWLLTERLEEVKTIMSDNGTYLQVPPVGSQASLITVFGDHRVNIERTIRSIMALACQFYVASVWLLPLAYDVMMPQQTLNPAQMQPILKRISHASGAEVVFKSNCFEMHGSEEQVRAAVLLVLDLDIIQGFHHEIRFQIELANEHRDFISGKKNGKINKIMKLAGVKIKFETFNDYNFLMDVAGSDASALNGLSMLQEELPAEMSFHVPESYHKRIIGVAGRNIQRIMKLYGVYVKFSNAEEYAALGGYADNEDNVVARTPAKNAVNLESLKRSIMELVVPKDKDYIVEAISIPRRYHRTLLGEKSIFIHDIENKTNSQVRFPYKESASDVITIFGPESQVHIAAAMLLDHVPFEAELRVLPSPELTALVASTDFTGFAEGVKRDYQIAIAPPTGPEQGEEATFMFRCQRSHLDHLMTARDELESFLDKHDIQVYPDDAPKSTDSFADAFHHFNSKSLATRSQAAQAVASQAAEPNSEIIVPVQSIRARPIPTDVKALFDGPVQPGTPDDLSNGGRGFAGPLSYHVDPRRTNTSEFNWQSQSPQPIRTDLVPIGTKPTAEPSSKRESDPLIQDRVRQATLGPGVPLGPHPGHGHPRGASARTQSLDITSLNFARTLSSGTGGFGAMPASPAGMVGSSPITASGQYLPSAPGVVGNKGFLYDSGLDNVTNGNVHV